MKRTPTRWKDIRDLKVYKTITNLPIDQHRKKTALDDLCITAKKGLTDNSGDMNLDFIWSQTEAGWAFWKRLYNIQIGQPEEDML